MPIELEAIPLVACDSLFVKMVSAHQSCVCGHGVVWHTQTVGQCTEASCGCWRFRPVVKSDGQNDGYHDGASITDHPFTLEASDAAWDRCSTCGLAESAHTATEREYQVVGSYRCPNCVTTNKHSCNHPRRGERAL
jgi:hypothetical protein